MCTDFDVDFIAPSFKEAMFVEGDENGKTDCFEISILDDDDFETNTEEFRFYIRPTLISSDSTLLGEPSRISVFINDTEGMQKRLGSYIATFSCFSTQMLVWQLISWLMFLRLTQVLKSVSIQGLLEGLIQLSFQSMMVKQVRCP